jgi:hypothetical protein
MRGPLGGTPSESTGGIGVLGFEGNWKRNPEMDGSWHPIAAWQESLQTLQLMGKKRLIVHN